MRIAVRNCGQLVTMAGPNRPRVGAEMSELSAISNGAFVMDGPIVVWVGASADLPTQVDEIIDAEGRLVTPGLVDAHTHAVFAGNRANEYEMRAQGATYADIKAAGGGILSSVRATRAASHEELTRETVGHLTWMLQCGTTTAEVKSGYGLDAETEEKMLWVAAQDALPIRVEPTFLGAHAVPPEAASKATYVEVVLGMIPRASELARYCDIFVEEGYFDAADARAIMDTARAHGMKPRLHVDQFTNNGGAKLAAELLAKTADHLEQTDLDGMKALRRSGVIPVLLPASVYGLGLHKYPDARSMIAEGLPVVLATDFNPGSSPTPSLPFVMSLACTQMRMTPAESLTACTINAAFALDLGDTIGSLEPGKRADFVVWDVEDYRELPYWAGRSPNCQVWINGMATPRLQPF